MKLKKIVESFSRGYIIEQNSDYSKWKRNNVTLRGVKEFGKSNEVYGSFGKGLYTAALSNKAMAKQYGDVYFVVNAIPKRPKKVDSLNEAEIWVQKLINNFCKAHGESYSRQFFEANTTIEDEMLKLGYDGMIIRGRELVNYKPGDVKYFKTEYELQSYYEQIS